MICPKCGFEQPESPECMRCGVIVSRYRGPGPNATPAEPFAVPPPLPQSPRAASSSPPPLPPSGHETVRLALDPPPLPIAPAGGTVYQGPDAGTPAAEAMRQAPSFGSLQSSLRMAARRLAVGEVLAETFAIYFRNIIPFMILTALAFAPVFILGGYLAQAGKLSTANAAATAGLVGVATFLISVPIATAAITYGVFQQMRGQDSSLGSCLGVGLSCLPSVLSVAVLQLLLILGAVFVTLIPIAFLAGVMMKTSPGCAMLFVPLILLCYLPALVLTLRFFVAVPAAVEERPGAVDALKRSALLTEGERGAIFRLLFLLGLLDVALTVAAALVPRAAAVLQPLVSLVVIGLSATACAVTYYRLRSLKESIDVDQIASVFG
jgi:hypothetical protein